TDSPWDSAHRPLPSMMIATTRASRAARGEPPSRSGGTVVRGTVAARSDLHYLGFLVLQELIDLLHVVVGEPLHLRLGAALLVVSHVAVPHALLPHAHQ